MKTVTQFVNELNSIGASRVFPDWLQMIFCALQMQRDEETYLKTIERWKAKPESLKRLAILFAELTTAMEQQGDMLGNIYMEAVSFGQHGQFFTPQEVCDMMARMTIGDTAEDGKSVHDPACGSGRMLLASAKLCRSMVFVGQDVDEACCQMTAINMALNSLRGWVVHGNSLTLEIRNVWQVIWPGIIVRSSYQAYQRRFCYAVETVSEVELPAQRTIQPTLFGDI